MIPAEILKKVRHLEITTKHLVNDLFGGEYHSAFKGRGMEFAEVREYQFGDDVRNIDWNVTARTGKPFIKKFDEERELTVFLIVDASASGQFATHGQAKHERIAEIGALLSFAAIKNNDKIGLLIFTDKIEKFIPPRKGKTHVLRLIRELLYFQPENRKTNIKNALEHFNRIAKRKTVAFLISDLFDNNFEDALRITSKKHDLVPIQITDPTEWNLPNVGLLPIENTETSEIGFLDTSSRKIRENFAQTRQKKQSNLERFLKRNKMDAIHIKTDESYIQPLMQFFKMRGKRK
ncbi:DUF58 domain-containing protein [bacterium]|nr:DUF58 domain-containing protein [bacterium]